MTLSCKQKNNQSKTMIIISENIMAISMEYFAFEKQIRITGLMVEDGKKITDDKNLLCC
jgi:hypothetical protein